MTEQRTFADVILSKKRRTTRREMFFIGIDQVILWTTLEALIAPHYPKTGRGRRPLPVATTPHPFPPAVVQPLGSAGGGGHAL